MPRTRRRERIAHAAHDRIHLMPIPAAAPQPARPKRAKPSKGKAPRPVSGDLEQRQAKAERVYGNASKPARSAYPPAERERSSSFVRTLRCPSRGRLSAVRRCKHMILNGFRPPRYVPAAPADVFDALLATAPAPARPVAAASPKQPAPSAEFRARVREPGGSFEAAPS